MNVKIETTTTTVEQKLTTLEIAFKNADDGDWDDYSYDGKVFIVKKNGTWVGLYNMDCIRCIVVS